MKELRSPFDINFAPPPAWPSVVCAGISALLFVTAGVFCLQAWQLHRRVQLDVAATLSAHQELARLQAAQAAEVAASAPKSPVIDALDAFPWDY